MKAKVTKEMKAMFPYIPSEKLGYEVEYSKYKTERGLMNHLAKMNDEFRKRAEYPDVKCIRMSIEWRKSRTWGYNPHLDGLVVMADGECMRDNDITCSGCGYDKKSTVMADFLNRHLSGMLWRRRNFRTRKPPYGVSYDKGWFPYFDCGVGADSTLSVLKWLGFKLVSSSHGKTWDFYELER